MKIDIIISGDDIKENKLKNKAVVVIDMFRATSTIVTAFNNGCKELIPFLTIEETLEEAERIGRDKCILGGERNAVKIEGFNISNSPLEYSKDIVNNKIILMTTTNGTKTLTRCKDADNILIGAMINGKAVADALLKLNKDVVIVNAGTNGNFSMDDFICSGYIIDKIITQNNNFNLTDIGKTAHIIYKSNENIVDYVKNAAHYSVMKSLKLDSDIQYCIQKSIINIVPEYNGKTINITLSNN